MSDLFSRDSLGGQNSYRRVSGARSSRALSTIFQQLRKLDREIGEIDRRIKKFNTWWFREHEPLLIVRRAALDHKRHAIRMKRKGYVVK